MNPLAKKDVIANLPSLRTVRIY